MNTGLKRNNKEQYFTKQKVSKELINILNNLFPINKFDIVIEPSAGSGSFLKELDNFEIKKIISYDIDPQYKNIITQNYLDLDLNYKNCLVIGNPPFGRQSGLAKKFIKKSCNFCDVIAFILPKSFKKKSMYNCFDLFFHKVFEKDLDLNSFEFENKEYSVPCIFQIWKKETYKRIKTDALIPDISYRFVKKDDNPDLAFRRVGSNSGIFKTEDFNKLSSESHYFIKTEKKEKILEKIPDIEWVHNNTIGPKSISKQELISELNKVFDNLKI